MNSLILFQHQSESGYLPSSRILIAFVNCFVMAIIVLSISFDLISLSVRGRKQPNILYNSNSTLFTKSKIYKNVGV